jgi:hypothetical protein
VPREVRLDAEKVIPWDEALQDAETAGVVSQDLAKVVIATQTEPIQIKRLLNTPGE